MEPRELVAAAAKRLGTHGDADLAQALDLDGYYSPSRVRRWRKGENEPDYRATLALLKAAGLLREKPTRSKTPVVADAEIDGLLAELEGEIGSVFLRLRDLLGHQEQRESRG